MNKLILILLIVFLTSCLKKQHIGSDLKSEGSSQAISQIVDLAESVDLDITTQYSYSSISDEYKNCSVTALFSNEEPNANVEVNGFRLDKNEEHPTRHRHVSNLNRENFKELMRGQSGSDVSFKISNSISLSDLNTYFYIPKTSKIQSNYNKDLNTINLSWEVDPNMTNNFMIIWLRYDSNVNYNLRLDYSKGSAVIDLNTIAGSNIPFERISLDISFGTAKIVNTSNNKKVRFISVVRNFGIVYPSN